MTTSYNNVGGKGDRRSLITATTTATLGSGAFTNIIDGTQANNLYFNGAQSGREMLFDFGSGAAAIIDEFTYYQDGANTQGTWTFRASNDNATWTSLATGLNLGGSATDVHAVSNSTGFRYYSLLQTAGTTSSGPGVREIEFKIAGMGTIIADGEGHANFGGTGGTVTGFTTTLTDDIIIVIVANETTTSGAFRPVSSVSGGGLTWALRKQLQWNAGSHTNANNLEVWWAHAPTALSAVTITVAVSGGSVDDGTIDVFAVHGADTTTPFDPNGSLPASNTGTASDPSVASVSTSAGNSFLFSVYATPHPGAADAPNTGFTKIANFTNGGGTDYSTQQSQSKEFLTAQSGLTVTYNGLTQSDWGMIVDALQTTITSVSGLFTPTETADAFAFTGLGDILPDTTIILPGEGGAEPTTLAKVGVSAGILLPGGDTYYPPPPPSGTSGSWASTETKDAMAFAGGVLGGTWSSVEYQDTLAFIENPHGIWASTDAADVFDFAAPPVGSWASVETDDTMAFVGHPELYGIWASAEADDMMSGLGGVLGGSWHSTDTPDAWASTIAFPPFGPWESTEAADTMAAAGHIPPRGTWDSVEGTDRSTITGDVLATFFDPLTASSGIDFQALDLTIVNQQAYGVPSGAKSNTSRTTGKYYAEFRTFLSSTGNSGVGIGNALATFAGWGHGAAIGPGDGPAASGAGCFEYENGSIWIDGVQQSNWNGSIALWDAIVRVAIDLDNNLIWFSINGGYWNGISGANPADGIASPRPPSNQPQSASGGYDISAITAHGPIYLWAELVGAYDKVTMNPGNSAFAYSVPSGFSAWDTALPITPPLQLDGYASGNVNGPITTGSVTLSTTKTDDVIVLGVSTGGYWNAATVDHVTSSSGLVWKRRNRRWQSGGYKDGASTIVNSGLDGEIWWAHAPATLTGEVITVHMADTTGAMGLIAFGVSGANYTTPWDKHTQAGGYVDNVGDLYYFPPTAELSTKASNTFLFGFHVDGYDDAGVTQAPWAYVASAKGNETSGYERFLSLVYQIVEEPQINTDVVTAINVAGIGNCYTARNMMFDSIVAADESGTAQEIVWFWDPNSTKSSLQFTTGTTMQLSYSAVNFNLMVIIEVAIMSASGLGTVTSISESQGSLSSAGFERRSRTVTSTPLGPLAVEIWWGWMPMYTGAERANNDTITINTAHMGAGDIIGAIMMGLGGSTGAFGLGDPFWDVDPSVPAANSNSSASPPPYATDINTTIPSDLVVAWTANNTTNVPGYTDPFVSLVQDYPRTVVPLMQLNSVAPPLFTGFEYYYEPGLATNETAEFLQTPEPNGWIVVADAIPVGPPQPPTGTMHIHDQQDKFTHDGDYSEIGIVGPGGWIVLPAIHGIIGATDHADEFTGAPAFAPWFGEGWLGWVPGFATWASTESDDQAALYGWVLGFGITGQLGATETKDRQAFSNRATVTGTMGAVETTDRWGSEGLVLPPGHIHPTTPRKRRLLIVT